MAPSTLPDGLVLRSYRGPHDLAEMNRVANLVRRATGDPNLSSVADIEAAYRQYDQAELPADCVLAELDGRLIAYGRATWEDLSTGDAEVGAFMNLDPAHAGEGIEELIVEHAVRRATTLMAARRPERPAAVRMWINDRAPHQIRAAEAAGFRRVRAGAQMIRPTLDDIPDVGLPAGYEIRPISSGDEAMHRRVWEADSRAFAETWGHEAPTERAYEAWRSSPSFDPPLWRVAFHGDDIAGQILNYMGEPQPDGDRVGFTEAISVQPEHRRRGLARALLAASLRAVRDAGATRAGLGVDSQNPNEAQALYASMDYEVVTVTYTYELPLA
ncbi:MAG TPA: GNAT family N-acetyltransferase [Candidatus Limnocylindrales bacterium]|nr:GNAT family N-acetyltransferase [Candidatus Limnocylindrales bacterium]